MGDKHLPCQSWELCVFVIIPDASSSIIVSINKHDQQFLCELCGEVHKDVMTIKGLADAMKITVKCYQQIDLLYMLH